MTRNVITNAKLSGYAKETETQSIGTKYQHYILMIPLVLLIRYSEPAKASEILSTQDAADKALAELEAEISKRQNNYEDLLCQYNPEDF